MRSAARRCRPPPRPAWPGSAAATAKLADPVHARQLQLRNQARRVEFHRRRPQSAWAIPGRPNVNAEPRPASMAANIRVRIVTVWRDDGPDPLMANLVHAGLRCLDSVHDRGQLRASVSDVRVDVGQRDAEVIFDGELEIRPGPANRSPCPASGVRVECRTLDAVLLVESILIPGASSSCGVPSSCGLAVESAAAAPRDALTRSAAPRSPPKAGVGVKRWNSRFRARRRPWAATPHASAATARRTQECQGGRLPRTSSTTCCLMPASINTRMATNHAAFDQRSALVRRPSPQQSPRPTGREKIATATCIDGQAFSGGSHALEHGESRKARNIPRSTPHVVGQT